VQRVADEVGRGLVAGVEEKDALVQELLLREALAGVVAGDEPREHVGVGVARIRAARFDERREVRQHLRDGAVARGGALVREHRLQRAEDRERPCAERPALRARHAEEVADHLDRNRRGEILDQVDAAARRQRVEQVVDEAHEPRLHRRDMTLRQRAQDRTAHARVQRRIVEHQARRVMLEERRRAVFGAEFLLLVRAERLRIAVHRGRCRRSASGTTRRPACR
jgi:hypothetical protein